MTEAGSKAGFRPPAPAGPLRGSGSTHPSTTDRPAERADETGGDSTDGGRTLVKVTVNLTPRAVDALDITCARTRDSKTDTINRALVVYQIVLELMDRGGGQLMFQDQEGHTERIHLL